MLTELNGRGLTRAAWALTVTIFIVGIALRSLSIINHDTAWWLYLTSEVLDGAELYVDIMETNPPFMVWLNIPSVLLANLTGLPLATVFKAFVFLLAGGSLWLCAMMIRVIKIKNGVFLLPVLAFVFTLMPAGNFGQREHLLVLFSLPYLLLIFARSEGARIPTRLVIAAAIMGLHGFLIKPYFVPIPIVMELYLFYEIGIRKTFLRIEPYILGFGAALYLLIMWFYTPAYFSRVLPYAAEVYKVGFTGASFQVYYQLILPAVLSVISLIWIKGRGTEHISGFFKVIVLASMTMFVMFVYQGKGWSYHMYPAFAYLLIALFSLLVMSWKPTSSGGKFSLISTVLGSALVAASLLLCMNFRYSSVIVDRWGSVIDSYPETETIYIMTTNVSQGFPLVTERDLEWGSRFVHLWTLPGLQIRRQKYGHTDEILGEIEDYTRQAVAEDLAHYKPDLIFVDIRENKPYFGSLSFDYIAYFSEYSPFKAQWSAYEKVQTVNEFEIYQRKKM